MAKPALYIDLIGEEPTAVTELQETKTSTNTSSTKKQPKTKQKETDEVDSGATKDIEIQDYVR